MNGCVMWTVRLDGTAVHDALSLGINPLPIALRRIANEIDVRDAQ